MNELQVFADVCESEGDTGMCNRWQYEIIRKITPELDGDAWLLADWIPDDPEPGKELHIKILCAGCGGTCTITETQWREPVFRDPPICTKSCKRCAIQRGVISNCPKEEK